jgi:hypothetical protein
VIKLKLLTALNVATDDDALLEHINYLSDFLADGTVTAECDGDQIVALVLTEAGRACLPASMTTTTSA